VFSSDANHLTSDPVVITATTLGDTTAPSAPLVTVSAVTSAGAHFAWTAATDDVGVTGYTVSMFEDGTWVPMTSVAPGILSSTVTGLLPDTDYTVGIASTDAAGNTSRTTVAFTTLRAPRFTRLPIVTFVAGSTATNSLMPTRVSWATAAASTCKTEVGQTTAAGWTSQVLGAPLATFDDWRVGFGGAHRLRVQVTDCAGSRSPWEETPVVSPLQVPGTALTYSKGWATVHAASYIGGGDRYISAAGASVTARVTHTRAIALIGSCGAGRGTARIYIDGKLSATVNEHCTGGVGRVMYGHRFAVAGAHTLKVVVAAAKRFDVDALVTM
jgi:hypothetical protein